MIIIFKHAADEDKDWSMLVDNAIKNMNSTPKENGVTAKHTINGKNNPEYQKQISDCHLPQIISHAISNHIINDRKNFADLEESKSYIDKYKDKIIKLVFEKLVNEQKFKCAYSNVPLTILNSAMRFSFERIDNSKPHFGPEGDIDNIVFICRIFNSRAGMNRRKFLQCFLSQQLVSLSDSVRAKLTEEYNELLRQHNSIIV
jgi:hypothetical protein